MSDLMHWPFCSMLTFLWDNRLGCFINYRGVTGDMHCTVAAYEFTAPL